MKIRAHIAALLLLLTAGTAQAAIHGSGRPTSTNNDDSCDIALLPAATLLVPYFEVDLASPHGKGVNTLLTVTNVSNLEQAAHVTLWTDWGFPVLDFNVYLTGYDVQSLSLYDIIALGQLAPFRGTGFEDPGSPEGDFSGNNPLVQEETCYGLVMQMREPYMTRLRRAFTEGIVPALARFPSCSEIGAKHANAVGYVTIDVTSRCGATVPTDPDYYQELLFDNVLMGDYQQFDPASHYAEGGPMVHIRAIPEGGTVQQRAASPETYGSNFPRTFYSRYQDGKSMDGRQPLPSQFAAHWISGGPAQFSTSFRIWREGAAISGYSCGQHVRNAEIPVAEIVRFDEDENPTVLADPVCCGVPFDTLLPVLANVSVDDEQAFPPEVEGATAGWMFMNLDDPREPHATQAWVVAARRARGGYAVSGDVVALGNGCSAPLIGQSTATDGHGFVIAPAADANP
jgi:hypothetical protein